MRIVGLCGHAHHAVIFVIAQLSCLYMLPVAVAQFSYDGVAICYLFPILRITSRFHMGPMKHDVVQTTTDIVFG